MTYNDIRIRQTLGNVGYSPKVALMRFSVGITIQAPHRPAPLGLLHLQASAVRGHREKFETIASAASLQCDLGDAISNSTAEIDTARQFMKWMKRAGWLTRLI
jgi:hypothetical protein